MEMNVVPATVTITDVPTGLTSQVAKTYDSGIAMIGLGAGTNVLYGNVLTATQDDYGSGKPGPPLGTTTNSYLAFNNSNYLKYNMLSLLSSVQVTDGRGTQRAFKTYGYDETGCSAQDCGNQTSIHRWLNTTGGY